MQDGVGAFLVYRALTQKEIPCDANALSRYSGLYLHKKWKLHICSSDIGNLVNLVKYNKYHALNEIPC